MFKLKRDLFLVSLFPVLAFGSGLSRAEETSPNAGRVASMRAEADVIRNEGERIYVEAVPQCYKRFLVNHCLDKARETRLEAVHKARALSIEAGRLELAEKQRIAVEKGYEPIDDSIVEAVAPVREAQLPAQDDSAVVRAREIRQAREAEAVRAEAAATAVRVQHDEERAAARAKAEASAADRAGQAARDRERYEERLRQREEKL